MLVRVTTIRGQAGSAAAAVDYLENTARPAVENLVGQQGLATLTDDDSTVVVAAYWDSPESLAASADTVAKVRASAAGILGGVEPSVEVFEAAYTKRYSIPPPGAIGRLIRATIPVEQIDAAIAYYIAEVVPPFVGAPGLCSVQLLVDRATGRSISVAGWDDQAAIDAAEPLAQQVIAAALAAIPGLEFTGVEQYAIVRTTAQLAG